MNALRNSKDECAFTDVSTQYLAVVTIILGVVVIAKVGSLVIGPPSNALDPVFPTLTQRTTTFAAIGAELMTIAILVSACSSNFLRLLTVLVLSSILIVYKTLMWTTPNATCSCLGVLSQTFPQFASTLTWCILSGIWLGAALLLLREGKRA